MRNHHTGRGSVRGLHVALVASLLAIITPTITSTRASAATDDPPSPWVGSGPATVTTTSDGSIDPPQMVYNLVDSPVGARFSDKTWTLQRVADSGFQGTVPYTYTGFHAYFQVRVHVDAFVTHPNGTTETFPLVNVGPISCCTPPSGGFSYSGSYSFHVEDGDTYGFKVGGFNFDSNPSFTGTLTLTQPGTPPYQDSSAVASNTSWTNALPLTSAVDGTLTQSGEARWYKFPIQPDSQVQVDLSNLDQNFDLTMFRDIGQAFTSLVNTQDLTKLSAQFAGDAFSPSVYSPSVYSPSVYSPSVYSPSVYSPSVYSPSVYSPSVYSPSVYSPSVYSPSVYSPSVYSPSVYSPSVYSPSSAFLSAFSGAQTRSLIGVSARENAESESIRSATWNNTGDFYVRVQGRNGAFSPTPFHLGLTTAGGPCSSITLDSFSSLSNVVETPRSAAAVILTDSSRLVPTPGLTTSLTNLAGATNGIVLDVNKSARIHALNAQADANAACPFAKNLVAEAIRDVVNSFRDNAGTLKYVVIAGGDSVIPFFRYADASGLGPESDFVPPVSDPTASQASLRRNYVLGQDAYGAKSDLTIKGSVLPVPDLAVGRLVETQDEIAGMIDTFLALPSGNLPRPTSSLVTGYDFLTSAADSVQTDFAAGLGTAGRADTLITNQGVPTTTTTVGTPSRDRSWTAADLSASLLQTHHDLVFLAGHFSANDALAADYQTSITTADLEAHPQVLKNSVVISAGCHAGYNLLDADGVPGLTRPLDWPEAMAKQQATLIAGTGYQYADTDFLAYSAKLYALLASQLREGVGAVSLGQALVNAKQDYLARLGTLNGIDQKALIESTLYGLPMTGVDLPTGRTTPAAAAPGVTPGSVAAGTPGAQLGLKTAPLTLNPALTTPPPKPVLDLNGNPLVPPTNFSWLVGQDGVQSGPALPALPKQIDDVTSRTGEVLRGVGFVGGTYSDTHGVIPLTGAPTTEQNGIHTNFASPVFFPQRLATVNYFGALDGSGTDGRTRLVTTPAQYRSDGPTTTTDTERKYSQLGLQLYYSSNTATYGANIPALAAPPAISGVTDTVLPGAVPVSVHVTGDPSAGIQKAWLTFTAEQGSFYGAWQSVDLVQDSVDSTLWTGTIVLPAGQNASDVRYIVQAVNGVGMVGLDNNLGDGYTPGVRVGFVPVQPVRVPTTIVLDPTTPATGVVGTSVAVGATLVGAPPASEVTFSLGSFSVKTTVGLTGHATATIPLQDAVGNYTVTASYAGDAAFKGSTDARSFGIVQIPTALTVAPGAPGTVSAVLSRTVPGIPLSQQTVVFTIAGPVSKQLTATTDPQGRATVPTGVLPDGNYTVTVDFAGTPSTFSSSTASTVIVRDTVGPVVTGLTLTPPSIVAGGNTTLTASVVDPSGIARVEYFVGPDPGLGLATAATVSAGVASATFGSNLAAGAYTVGLRALDNAGNWSPVSTATLTVTAPPVVQMGISVSTNVNRTGAIDLAGAAVSGNIAVFATPVASPSRVVLMGFYFDDPNRSSVPYWIQLLAPFDLNGTSKTGTANLFDSRLLLNGTHTLTVELLRLNGTLERRTVTFTVNNPAPAVTQKLQVSTTATRTNPVDLNGRTVTGSVAIFVTPTTSVKSVAYWLDKPNVTVLPRSIDTAAQFDFNGTASNGQAVLFNVGTLAAGSHRIAALVTYTNGTTAVISSTFTK